MDPSTPYVELIAPFAITGIGMALVFPTAPEAVLAAVRPAEAGKASGATNAVREIGAVLGVAVLASVFARLGGYESGDAFVEGMSPAILIGAAVVGAGAVAAFFIPSRRRRDAQPVGQLEPLAEAA
jgi:MFS family permease